MNAASKAPQAVDETAMGHMAGLIEAIAKTEAAYTAWLQSDRDEKGNLSTRNREYKDFEEAEARLLAIECWNVAEVSAKVKWLLNDDPDSAARTIAEVIGWGDGTLETLLKSFLGLDPEKASQKGGTA